MHRERVVRGERQRCPSHDRYAAGIPSN